MIKKIVLQSVILLSVLSGYSQLQIGQWNEHLPYYEGIDVAQSDDKILCASKMGVFYVEKSDRSVHKLSRISGLSEVGIGAIGYNPATDHFVIAYSNSGIDILEGQQVYSLPDIKNKIMTGDKRINHLFFKGSSAFLSCGFGIVVLDLVKKEVMDTWLIGDLGAKVKVSDFTTYEASYFAATESGLYHADTSNAFLANFANWSKMPMLVGADQILEVEVFDGMLYIIVRMTDGNRRIMRWTGTEWETPSYLSESGYRRMNAQGGKLVIVRDLSLEVFDPTGFRDYLLYDYSFGMPAMRDALIDENQHYWIADENHGLVFSSLPWHAESIVPNGPFRESAFDMKIEANQLWVAGGGRDPSYTQIYSKSGIYTYQDATWENINVYSEGDLPDYLFDITEIAIDPLDPKRVFAGSWGCGVLEFYDKKLIKVHNDTNSTLQTILPGSFVRIGGMAFDRNNNLWVSNANVYNILNCYTPEKEWFNLPYGAISSAEQAGQVMIDRNNFKWVVLPKGDGLFILDDNDTPGNVHDDRSRKLTVRNEEGEVVNDVFSIAEDQDGIIWVGTNQGVLLFYNSWSVFDNLGYYGNRIIVNLDGTPQVLLGTETINDIVVDGANRKWLATQNGGAFLMSADGREQIAAYNPLNSPLLSNTVLSIAINQQTGEVFFGTDQGISSLMGEATSTVANFTKLEVFPNPVRPEFEGEVVIRGMVPNTLAHITDVSGNLVSTLEAYGGQVVWNRKDLSGREVSSGVYLIFCSGEDGTKSEVAKLLIIK
jgi:hypothetical protein